jgi:hypothetical protein
MPRGQVRRICWTGWSAIVKPISLNFARATTRCIVLQKQCTSRQFSTKYFHNFGPKFCEQRTVIISRHRFSLLHVISENHTIFIPENGGENFSGNLLHPNVFESRTSIFPLFWHFFGLCLLGVPSIVTIRSNYLLIGCKSIWILSPSFAVDQLSGIWVSILLINSSYPIHC